MGTPATPTYDWYPNSRNVFHATFLDQNEDALDMSVYDNFDEPSQFSWARWDDLGPVEDYNP